jgi:hypothetical protein
VGNIGNPDGRQDQKPNRLRGTFRMVPDALWQSPDLIPIDTIVWCALCQHARDRPTIASNNRGLAVTAGTSVATIKRSLSRLTVAGFVQPQGDTSSRVIHLCPDAVEAIYTLRIAN